MATGPIGKLMHRFRLVLAPAAADDRTDGHLLEQFADHQDQSAFAALVQRHGPMVLGVTRRLLGNPHDAEDAFQATFLVLARKAGSIGKRDSLASWLYGVAYRTALKARGRDVLRKAHEREAAAMESTAAETPGEMEEVLTVLDQELNRLPWRYRTAVVLHHLQGQRVEEAAERLGWTTGQFRGALFRARQLLKDRFQRRGIVLSLSALASFLEAGSLSAAVPSSLADSTVSAATAFALGQAMTAPAGTLAKEVLTAMGWGRLKLVGIPALLFVLLAGGGWMTFHAMAGPKASGTPNGAEEAETKTARAPGSATFRNVRGGKPPLRFFHVALELENRHDHPVWFLTRYYGDDPLAPGGKFETGGHPAQPFEGRNYETTNGSVVRIHCLGKQHFIGFYLAAGARIKFEDYTIEAWDDITAMELWEVGSLKVNDRTPLEQWLPFPVLNDAKTAIPAGDDWKNLNWDAEKLRSRTDFPNEAVRSVNAKGITKWTIPIKGLKKVDPWR